LDAQPSTTAEVLRRLAGSDLPEWGDFERSVLKRRLGHGEALFRTGDTMPSVFIVSKGLIKMVYETRAGDCWIKGFAESGVCFASLTALDENGVASYSTYAETETHVDQIDYSAILRLAERHIEWQRALGNAFKLYGQRKERREMELLTLSPRDRYLSFIRNHPGIASIVKQRDIESYVRVTPVALSRIRSRLRLGGVIG